MSPFSRPVLLPSLALCSPVLWDAYRGVVSWSDALTRFLLVLGLCWLAVSVVHAVAFSPTRTSGRGSGDVGGDGASDEHLPGAPGGPAGLR